MKLLVDVNLSPRWVEFFRAADIEAVRWSSVGAPDAEDEEILTWANRQGYVVVTHDQDFSTLLAYARAGTPSVILLRTSSLKTDSVGARVLRAIEAAREQLEDVPGAVLVIGDDQVRLRPLPIE